MHLVLGVYLVPGVSGLGGGSGPGGVWSGGVFPPIFFSFFFLDFDFFKIFYFLFFGGSLLPPEADSGIWSMSGWYASYWNAFLYSLFTARKRSLGQSNVFTPVRGGGGGVCIPACNRGVHPPSRHPLRRNPHPPDGNWSGRYASYWNTLIFWYKVWNSSSFPKDYFWNLSEVRGISLWLTFCTSEEVYLLANFSMSRKLTVCFERNSALEFAVMIHSSGHSLVYNCTVPANLRRSSPSLLSSAPVADWSVFLKN